MEPSKPTDDEALFERTMRSLEAQITNVGGHLAIDTKARLLYTHEIKRMADRLRADATARRITWAAAARRTKLQRFKGSLQATAQASLVESRVVHLPA